MKSRRNFLTAVASGSVALSLAPPDGALAQVSPAPVASASAPAPSSGAVAFAAKMRAEIDPALSQEQLAAIARAIDANALSARTLNPKKKRLANGIGPAVRFTIADRDP